MHMSDALLSPAVALPACGAAVAMLVHAARRAGREAMHERRVPLMGIMAAFVFAAQMVNFAIPGTGSSGHLGGGLLLAILLGPQAAYLAMASVLTVQCLLFADGGLLALGCNTLNLALWPCIVGLPLYRLLAGASPAPRRQLFAAVVSAIACVELGALGVAVETALSGRSDLPFARFGAVILGIHLPIGLVEGLVTAGVLRVLQRAGRASASHLQPTRPWLALAALAVLFTGGVLAHLASSRPDGLEWSMARLGANDASASTKPLQAGAARVQEHTAVLPDYTTPAAPRLGLSLAGVGGSLAVGGIVCALGLAAARAGRSRTPAP